jgi:hypothetical protein
MRLLPGYVTAPAPARAAAVRRPAVRVSATYILDAVSVEVLPSIGLAAFSAPAGEELLRGRAAIHQYSSIDNINQQPTGRLDVYA